MGKYTKVVEGLPNLPPEEPGYQSKIDKIKEQIKAVEKHTPESLAKQYVAIREAKDDLKGQLSIVQEQLTAIEQLLTESLDRDEPGWGMYGAGPTTVKLPNGASVSIQFEPTGKVEDKERFRIWCIENGLENSLQLWPTTMNSIVKERLLNGEKAPDGVKAYVNTKIVLRGA